MTPLLSIGVAVATYFVIVSGIGFLAGRRSGSSPEEYFLAGRGLGTLVLFMALFGTNMSSFVLVGIPGLAYQTGIGVFGLNAPMIALVVPLTFWAVGAPARRLAQELGALTPADLYARRLGSRPVGFLLFGFFTLYTIPYMVQGVKAAALVLSQATDEQVAPWLVGLAVIAVALLYTSLGGMRATAWTNVFQGALFLVFMVMTFFLMARSLGGLTPAMQAVQASDPDLLRLNGTGLYEPRRWVSWGLVISTTVIAFPHMLARLMAAANDDALKRVVRLYPIALVLLWVPAVLIGVWGRASFPDLSNSDRIFQAMATAHLPGVVGAFAFLAVLAAVMSTLDAQMLTLSSMLVRDVIEPLRGRLSDRAEVLGGRLFTLAVAAVVYFLSLTWGDSVFDISRKAFEGYTTLVPTLVLGMRWDRFRAPAAAASILTGNAVLALGWSWPGFPTLGFLPAFWSFAAAWIAAVVVTLVSERPPARAHANPA